MSGPPPAPPPAPRSFTDQLERLEEIVRRLEVQELDLDEALRLFEEGIERLREARERLTAADARVKQVLADQAGTLRFEDLDALPPPPASPLPEG